MMLYKSQTQTHSNLKLHPKQTKLHPKSSRKPPQRDIFDIKTSIFDPIFAFWAQKRLIFRHESLIIC
jgi:hypothetical protein